MCWLKCLILARRLHSPPPPLITAVLLSQYKSEQHHVIAVNACLLFGQKSTNLTIFLVFTVLIILLMDVRNIISFANIKKTHYLTRFYEKCYFLLNYVTRFPENQSESESRIVQLIGNRFLGSSAWLKTPTN